MDLRFSSLLLVVGLFLGSTADNCEHLVKALSPLTDLSEMHGRMNLIMGYNDNKVLAAILNITQSYWFTLTEGSGSHEHFIHQKNRINGVCVSSTVRLTIEDDAIKMQMGNLSTVSHVLPSSNETAVFSFNYTAINFNMILKAMNLSSFVNEEMEGEMHAHALYLFAKESTVKDSDVEHFKNQAACLGFSGEPNFIYNHENKFCVDGEGITLKTEQ